MTNTYDQNGLDEFNRQTPTHHGHCYICGWDPKFSMARKTRKRERMKFDVLPFVDFLLNEEDDS